MALSPFDPAEPYPPVGMGAPAAPILPIAPQPSSGVPMAAQLPDVDPLTGLPAAAPPPEPQGYQFDASGEPLKWPPDSFFEGMEGAAPGYTGHDVPEVPNEQAPLAPEQPPAATAQAGPQALSALEQGHAQTDTYTAAQPGRNAPRRSTGDPYLDTMYAGEDAKARAAVKGAEAEKQKNLYLSEEGSRAAQQQAQRQAAADKEYREVYNEAKAHREQLDKEAQEIANTKTDTHRAWHSMSLGQQVAVAVTAYLSSGTAASRAGHNPVLEALNQQVQTDLAAQQADLENRWKGNGVRRGLLADELAAGRDMYDVQYKALNVAYDTAMNQAKSYAMRFDNPVLDAKTDAFIAETMERKAQLGHDLQAQKEQQLYARRQQGFQNALALRQQRFAEYQYEHPQTKAPSLREQVQLSKEQREQEQDRSGRLIHLAKTKKGEDVIGPTPKVADEVNNAMANTTSVVQGLRRLKEIRAKNGVTPFGSWNNDDIKEATYIYEDLLAGWSQAKEQGVIRDAEYKRYERMFGSMTGVLDPTANLDAVEHTMVQGMNNKLQARVGKEVAHWSPENVAPPSFAADGTPKKVPAPAGLPNDPGEKKMSREEQQLVDDGKFTPTAPAGPPAATGAPAPAGNDGLVLLRSRKGEHVVPRSSIPLDPSRYQVMPDGSFYDNADDGDPDQE